MLTGQTDFFEKGKCSLSRAVQASATVPYLSRPVVINGTPYMDGGCSTKVPYRWAVEDGQKKIVVVKTREREYRRKVSTPAIAKRMYKDYPSFVEAIPRASSDFNQMMDEFEELEAAGEIFVIAPSKKVDVSRFDGNMEKLGNLYWLGYNDMQDCVGELKAYLNN